MYTEIQEIKEVLQNLRLYDPESSKEEIEQLESERLTITLYTKDGIVLYHSSNLFRRSNISSKRHFIKIYIS